jgi:hypothetical protein
MAWNGRFERQSTPTTGILLQQRSMSDPSLELLAANERLLARAQLARQRAEQKIERRFDPPPAPEQPAIPAHASLPPHLGWHSPAVTAALRARQERQAAPTGRVAPPGLLTAADQPPANAPLPNCEPGATTSHFQLPTPFCPLPSAFTLPSPGPSARATGGGRPKRLNRQLIELFPQNCGHKIVSTKLWPQKVRGERSAGKRAGSGRAPLLCGRGGSGAGLAAAAGTGMV